MGEGRTAFVNIFHISGARGRLAEPWKVWELQYSTLKLKPACPRTFFLPYTADARTQLHPRYGLSATSAPAAAPPMSRRSDPCGLTSAQRGERGGLVVAQCASGPEKQSPAVSGHLKVRFGELGVEIYDPGGQSVKRVSSSVLTERKKTYL